MTISGNVVAEENGCGIGVEGEYGITITGNVVLLCKLTGILLDTDTGDNIVEGNIVKNNGLIADATYKHGIQLNNSVRNCVIGNRCFDDQGVKKQDTGILESGTSDYNVIQGNSVLNNLTNGMSIVGANDKIRDNSGYVSENSGSDIGTGLQQTIAHGCAFTPTYDQVFLSERTTGLAIPYQSAVPDAVNIYVTAVLNKTYNWRVSLNP